MKTLTYMNKYHHALGIDVIPRNRYWYTHKISPKPKTVDSTGGFGITRYNKKKGLYNGK